MKYDPHHGQISSTRQPALRISVALCTYNGERYLQKQLDSIAAQSRPPNEIVVCDDDSTDSTPNILKAFAASVPFRVRIEQNSPRLGTTANFEKAIQLCAGDLIALCDQDDLWGPNKLRDQVTPFEVDPSLGGLFSNAVLVDAESKPIGRTLWKSIDFGLSSQRKIQSGQAASVLLSGSVVTGATLMFRGSLVPIVCPIPRSWVHDGWIAWMIALNSKLDLIPEILSDYRIHSGQQCGVPPSPLQRIRKQREAASRESLAIARQLQDLHDYLNDKDGDTKSIWQPLIQKKIEHLTVRSGLPANRISRLLRLIPEFGNYRKFSRGWKSALKDIVIG